MPQIRGAFPLPVSNLFEGMGRIALASGASFYFPSGNYIITTDGNTVIEVWDPVETTWRTFVTANNSESVFCDGYNFRGRNTSGTVTAAVNAAGSAMTNGIGPLQTGITLSISGGTQAVGGPVASFYAIVGGTVAAPTITQAGSGFVVPPLIVIDPPPIGGIQASAICALTAGGAIASVTMVNAGAGYQTSPNFWIVPQPSYYQGGPPGGPNSGLVAAPIVPGGLVNPANALPSNPNTGATGALLTPVALTGSGTLTGIGTISNGGGYTATTAPTIALSSGNGTVTATIAVVAATAIIRSQPRVQ